MCVLLNTLTFGALRITGTVGLNHHFRDVPPLSPSTRRRVPVSASCFVIVSHPVNYDACSPPSLPSSNDHTVYLAMSHRESELLGLQRLHLVTLAHFAKLDDICWDAAAKQTQTEFSGIRGKPILGFPNRQFNIIDHD